MVLRRGRTDVLDSVIRYLRVLLVSLVPISGDLCLIDYRFAAVRDYRSRSPGMIEPAPV